MSETPTEFKKYQIAYGFGMAGLIIMAIIGFFLSFVIMNLDPAVWGFSGFISFSTAFFVGPFWLIIGINCLSKTRIAPKAYATDLAALGVLNILGILFTAFFPILYHVMLAVWFLYYSVVFSWFFYRSYQRKKSQESRSKTTKTKADSERFWITLVVCLVIIAIIILIASHVSFGNLYG